jgi:acetyl esterase/lipase
VIRRLLASAALGFLAAHASAPAHAEGRERAPWEDAVRAMLGEQDPTARFLHAHRVLAAAPRPVELAAALAEGRAYAPWAGPREPSWTRQAAPDLSSTVYAYVPKGYDPSRRWPVLVWLHGGVSRAEDGGGRSGVAMLAQAAEARGFLVVAPSSRSGAEWWTPAGTALVRGALRDAAERWRVDPDRVLVAGFSDGGSGCFHLLSHDPEPYACFAALMPHPVLTRLVGGPSFGANVASRPVWAVSGGSDPLYPASVVKPMIEGLRAAGCDLTWQELPESGHDLGFLSSKADELFSFWEAHPRKTVPTSFAWETSVPAREGRRAWVEIVEASAEAPAAPDLASTLLPAEHRPQPRLGVRLDPTFQDRAVVAEVTPGSPAEEAGFREGDVVLRTADREVQSGADLRDYVAGLGDTEGVFTVRRDEAEVVLRARPRVLDADRAPRPKELGYDLPSAHVAAEVVAPGRIRLRTRGVAALRLHLPREVWTPGVELVVECNGREAWRGAPAMDLAAMLAAAVRDGPGSAPVLATLLLRP